MMRITVAILALILAVPVLANAQTFALLIESDSDRPWWEEVVLSTYNSLADLMSDSPASEDFTFMNLAPGEDVVGFASDGEWYRLLTYDPARIISLGLRTYRSLEDVINDDRFSSSGVDDFEPPSSSLEIVGFASDGDKYHLLLESESDRIDNEVFLFTYDSIVDFVLHNPSSEGYSEVNIGPDWSVHGFAFDGELYHLILESDSDEPFGEEVFRWTFESISALMDDNPIGFGWSDLNLGPPWSIGGLAGPLTLFDDGFESGDTSAWSGTVP